MAIERPAGYDEPQTVNDQLMIPPIVGEEVQLIPGTDEEINIEMTEDGGAIIGEEQVITEDTFDANLADLIDKNKLGVIASDLRASYDEDKSSRREWSDAYTKGLDLLGLKYQERTMPFAGASGVTHPLLAESVTQFQAQAYKELLPAGGPVRTQIIGSQTKEKEDQAQRVSEFMNYQIMHVMEEYDPELDQMLFYLPLAGSTFKKIYYDSSLGRAVSKFVTADDLVVPYSATDLQQAERVTHVIKKSANEVRKLQVGGFYRDVDLQEYDGSDRIEEKERRISGVQKVGYSTEEYTLLEIHVNLDVPGFEDPDGIKLPYIITIDEGSGNVLSIYRNYKEGDSLYKKQQYFVHYKFMPGLGFYGLGLIHMLGGLSRTATSALRQLIDAGTLSNLPAGFKARGLRIKDDDTPLQPGEFRDVDAPSGDLRQGLLPLPYKGADPTLFQLLGFCVQAGKEFATVADQKIGDAASAGAPVGTTMAVMERGMRVMSAIHKRIHYAQRIEFKLLAKIFAESLPPLYPYEVQGDLQSLKATDFDEKIDIIPVSDPTIFSMSQRVTLAQTQLQLAEAAPQMHNMYEAYRRMYAAMGVQNIDAILPIPTPPQPKDPGVENALALSGQSLTAFRRQNQMAHVDAHRAFFSSFLVKNNPQVMSILQAHIMEHVSLQAREEVEQEMQEEVKNLQQQAGGQLTPEMQTEMQELLESKIAERIVEMTEAMVTEEQESLQQDGKDPLIDLKQQEINLKAGDLERKTTMDQGRLGIDQARLDQTAEIAEAKMDSQEDIAQLRANVNLTKQKEIEKSKKDPRTVDVNKNIRFDN
jgi:hypothetical protein|tara:strand:+ start:3937 stop:6381 length:2445 start_codon:yes stop_codon:yes gene_type:complete